MALTYTNRINSAVTGKYGLAAYTTSAFTPSNASLLCVVAAGMDSPGTTPNLQGTDLTIADSLTSTWTSRAATTTPPSWGYGVRAWTTPITTGASMTVSIDCGAYDIQGYAVWVFDVTGYDTGTPVTGAIIGSDADGNGVGTLTLAAAPTADDITIAATMVQTSGTGAITHGTGWTEAYETGETDWWRFQVQSRTGSTSTGVQWDDLSTSGTPYDAVMLAFIIKNAGGGGGAVIDPGVILPPPPTAFGPDRGFGFGY